MKEQQKQKAHLSPKKNLVFRKLTIILCYLHLIDLFTTVYSLQNGLAREGNFVPFLLPFDLIFNLFIMKAVALIMVLVNYWLYLNTNQKVNTIMLFMLTAWTLLYLTVCINNGLIIFYS